jgi:uncharacterized protein YciI
MKAALAAALGLFLLAGDQEPAHAPSPGAPPKLFAVLFRTGPAWDAAKPPGQQRFFKEHSQNLLALRKAGKIALGGRYADVGLVVVQAQDEAEVRALLAGDPSLAEGVFRADVHPWSTIYDGCVGR